MGTDERTRILEKIGDDLMTTEDALEHLDELEHGRLTNQQLARTLRYMLWLIELKPTS
jgi:hypothetical protein